jgi:hypothetical protein
MYCRLTARHSVVRGCRRRGASSDHSVFFSHGQLYHGLVFFFLLGAIVPLMQWVMHKRFKMNFLRYLNFPVIFTGTTFIPPATPLHSALRRRTPIVPFPPT